MSRLQKDRLSFERRPREDLLDAHILFGVSHGDEAKEQERAKGKEPEHADSVRAMEPSGAFAIEYIALADEKAFKLPHVRSHDGVRWP
jgi:hypothetical protein